MITANTRFWLAGLLALLLSSTSFAAKQTQPLELLFVQTAKHAELKATDTPMQYKLVLSGIDPFVSYFADRPYKLTGLLPVKRFTGFWQRTPFSPPNAAIELSSTNGDSHSSVLASITAANYNAEKQQVTYTISLLNRLNQPKKMAEFGYTVLFIDSMQIHWNPGGFGS